MAFRYTTIGALKAEAEELALGEKRLWTVWVKVKYFVQFDLEYWYAGCRIFDSEIDRYCRKAVYTDLGLHNEDDGIGHEGRCWPSMASWHLGLKLEDDTGDMNANIWNCAAYLFGSNGIPIFAKDVAKLRRLEQAEVMEAVKGDFCLLDIEALNTGHEDFPIEYIVRFVHVFYKRHREEFG
ncbi:unnamed protein product [Calypogeia fissa]